jgi:hypothetical protein
MTGGLLSLPSLSAVVRGARRPRSSVHCHPGRSPAVRGLAVTLAVTRTPVGWDARSKLARRRWRRRHGEAPPSTDWGRPLFSGLALEYVGSNWCLSLVVVWYTLHGHPPPMSPPTEPAHPGTAPCSPPRPRTCSHGCATSCPPTNICHLACSSPPARTPRSPGHLGHRRAHKVENRVRVDERRFSVRTRARVLG